MTWAQPKAMFFDDQITWDVPFPSPPKTALFDGCESNEILIVKRIFSICWASHSSVGDFTLWSRQLSEQKIKQFIRSALAQTQNPSERSRAAHNASVFGINLKTFPILFRARSSKGHLRHRYRFKASRHRSMSTEEHCERDRSCSSLEHFRRHRQVQTKDDWGE